MGVFSPGDLRGDADTCSRSAGSCRDSRSSPGTRPSSCWTACCCWPSVRRFCSPVAASWRSAGDSWPSRTSALAGSLVIAARRFSPLSPALTARCGPICAAAPSRSARSSSSSTSIRIIDTVMLGILSTDADTGLYNAAYRVYEGLTYVPAILSAVLTPRLSREYVTDRGRHRALARLGLVSSVALAAAVAAVTWMVGGIGWLSLLFGADLRRRADHSLSSRAVCSSSIQSGSCRPWRCPCRPNGSC